jgi:serine/threonine-protein kinase
MGAVYEGFNVRICRRVAVKVLHASIARERDYVARFEREAQAAARIGSGHIVDVFDLGDLPSGERFMVMEYLEGETLETRLKRGKVAAADAVTLAVQLLEGLAAVHEAGIVHRDLKPANIYLTATETGSSFVKILDFGVCKMAGAEGYESFTGFGQLLGTFSYLSPEAIEQGSKNADHRGDLYAVGVLLYRTVAGRLPHVSKNVVDLRLELRSGKMPRLDQVAEVDAGLADIVARAMDWDAAGRFQSARDFQKALRDWLDVTSRVQHLLTDFLEVPHVVRPAIPSAAPRAASSVSAQSPTSEPGPTAAGAHPSEPTVPGLQPLPSFATGEHNTQKIAAAAGTPNEAVEIHVEIDDDAFGLPPRNDPPGASG